MVSVLAFYSNDPSSIPTEVYNYSVKLLLKRTKINKKRPGLAHFLKKIDKRLTFLFATPWSEGFEYVVTVLELKFVLSSNYLQYSPTLHVKHCAVKNDTSDNVCGEPDFLFFSTISSS